MVPARNLLRRHYDSYGASFFDDSHHLLLSSTPPTPLLIHKPMAQEPSPPPTPNQEQAREEVKEQDEEDAGTSTSGGANSKAWLQLGLGPSTSSSRGEGGGPTELDLFPRASPPGAAGPPPPPAQWAGFRFISPSTQATASGSSSAPPEFLSAGAGAGGGGMRVILPPPRPQAGIWFVLQAARNQKEPFLPQITKSYLRIKDGRMKVRLLIKYLVNKLGLEHETEVEVTCRGQRLLPFLTIQHVRDNIWRSTEAMSSSSIADPPTADHVTDHVMTLQYSRSA
ncbi:uncharacterized protein [Typha angustifolia]|uniref:uncharacterized protein isoform X2 n=1 Tax=Typha angustifolia TaxID=59011 RepID=UPI003C2C1DDE